MHLFLDERVARLPHDWLSTCLLHGLGQCLRGLDIENDCLALTRPRQDVPRVDDEEIIAPDDLTFVVDYANAVGVSVERNANVGTILFHSGNQSFDILWNRRVGVMIRKRS